MNERLTVDDMLDASDIEVHVAPGTAILRGEVSVRWRKHRAEDLTGMTSGAKEVDDRIRVAELAVATGDFCRHRKSRSRGWLADGSGNGGGQGRTIEAAGAHLTQSGAVLLPA